MMISPVGNLFKYKVELINFFRELVMVICEVNPVG